MARRATAHKAVHRAARHRPSTLAKVGALLAAPLPDVELLIGAMANPDSGIKFVLGIAKKAGQRVSEVQSVIFDKLKWTADAAKQWLQDHGFSASGKDEGATFWRFRQQAPGKYREFRTIVPGRRRNPTPGESIESYQEHLETTTDPEFRSATPGEQAAAMTAQDLCENPSIQATVLDYNYDAPTNKTWAKIETQEFTEWFWVSGQVPRDKVLALLMPTIERKLAEFSEPAYNPDPLGSGERFAALESKLSARRDVKDPRALAAWIGRQKYGTKRFQRIAAKARRAGNPLGTREFLLMDVKHTRSAERLGRIIGVARSQGYDDVVEAAEKKAKRLHIRPETLETHAAKVIRLNPESEAAQLYEEFHGKPPGETLEIVTDKHVHEWLTQLGLLVELKVATLTNLEATLSFTKDAPNLCSSEDGRQLYIEGGDQALDLQALKMDGDKWLKDSMAIGVVISCVYQTEKGFHNFKLTDYEHGLGEDSGRQPFLLYDPRNRLLSISGGAYRVEEAGIID